MLWREGGIAPSLGVPVLGLEMLPSSRVGLPAGRERQQAAKAPCRRGGRSTVKEKGGKLFVGAKGILHGVFQSGKLMNFAVLERLEGRLHGFLAFCKDVAGPQSSVLLSYFIIFC